MSELPYKIYHDDCFNVFPNIADGSVDMICCDLPYGTTQNAWDSILDLTLLWEHYKRVIKPNGAIVLFSQMPFTAILAASNIQMLKYEWIWEKPMGTGFLNANRAPLKSHENILVFYKNMPTYNPQMREGFTPYIAKAKSGSTNYNPIERIPTIQLEGKRYPIDIIQFNYDTNKVHPTQKPVGLISYLIRTYTNEGELVLDNCMGSGSCGVAALANNRHFIGIEKEDKYFKIAKERIERETQSLF